MRLRARLALSVVAMAVPVLVAMAWWQAKSEDRSEEQALANRIRVLMAGAGRAQCEAAPSEWSTRHSAPPFRGSPPPRGFLRRHGKPPPPPPATSASASADAPSPRPGDDPGEEGEHAPPAQFYPYDTRLEVALPGAPEIPRSLIEAMRQGDDVAALRRPDQGVQLLEVLVKMPWATGQCAYVLARHHGPSRSAVLTQQLPWLLLPVGLAVGVMLLALGSVIRRIRTLATQMHLSARSGYTMQVAVSGADELTDLAHVYNDAAAQIRQQMDEQEQREVTLRAFLDNTTHDLMTPLTVLTGHLASLADAGPVPPDPQVLRSALHETHYMASLLHNLGAAARLEAGEPQIRRDRVQLGALVDRAVGRLRPIARLGQIALEHAVPPDPVETVGDVTLLEQAISNVIQNAVKYNHAGGHVAVVLDTDGDRFGLEVLDDGPGISPADLERLLRPHERGDGARTRDPHGRGLGLSITRRVAEVHGWTLDFGASEFGGLRVRFEGPRLAHASPRDPSGRARAASPRTSG